MALFITGDDPALGNWAILEENCLGDLNRSADGSGRSGSVHHRFAANGQIQYKYVLRARFPVPTRKGTTGDDETSAEVEERFICESFEGNRVLTVPLHDCIVFDSWGLNVSPHLMYAFAPGSPLGAASRPLPQSPLRRAVSLFGTSPESKTKRNHRYSIVSSRRLTPQDDRTTDSSSRKSQCSEPTSEFVNHFILLGVPDEPEVGHEETSQQAGVSDLPPRVPKFAPVTSPAVAHPLLEVVVEQEDEERDEGDDEIFLEVDDTMLSPQSDVIVANPVDAVRKGSVLLQDVTYTPGAAPAQSSTLLLPISSIRSRRAGYEDGEHVSQPSGHSGRRRSSRLSIVRKASGADQHEPAEAPRPALALPLLLIGRSSHLDESGMPNKDPALSLGLPARASDAAYGEMGGRSPYATLVDLHSSDEEEQHDVHFARKRVRESLFFDHQTCIPSKHVGLADYEMGAKPIGEGAFGKVWPVRHLLSDQVYACKVIRKSLLAESMAALRLEVMVMKRLDHPNIIKLVETTEDEFNLYMIMEICSGGELFDRIAITEHFNEETVALYFRQILSAVRYSHGRGVIHRDIKPENFLFDVEGPKGRIKMIDFGLAKTYLAPDDFDVWSIEGTPDYMAPETITGQPLNKACDLWAVGVVLYTSLCGYTPFGRQTAQATIRQITDGDLVFHEHDWKHRSPEVIDLIKGLLDRNPETRLTALQAYSHPWFRLFAATCDSPANSLSRVRALTGLTQEAIQRCASFRKQKKFRRMILTALARRVKAADIEGLRFVFEQLDTEGTGTISLSQVTEVLTERDFPDDMIKLAETVDSDNEGKISYTHFLACCLDRKVYLNRDTCREVFDSFDLNRDGKISEENLLVALERGMKRRSFRVTGKLQDREERRQKVREIIQQADSKGQGFIDFEDFMALLEEDDSTDVTPHRPLLDLNEASRRHASLLYSGTPSFRGLATPRYDDTSSAEMSPEISPQAHLSPVSPAQTIRTRGLDEQRLSASFTLLGAALDSIVSSPSGSFLVPVGSPKGQPEGTKVDRSSDDSRRQSQLSTNASEGHSPGVLHMHGV
ncbi:unnamed protein product [Vitrella brassicaformis CCMP3155]|uniref:non-specific serine/threonine protein kinase n=4 Tax=Vitrella brassicaformis TaxID=1169539 RepID=A0A0G4H784_VITBC|nr:unnamed protein product [Vitrella brassicaformis CCMP3155]|eukprot:CEM39769.1 unnamed protein product [Vitrella brassicaformis CCMP3155]